jgi:hypothetical protein
MASTKWPSNSAAPPANKIPRRSLLKKNLHNSNEPFSLPDIPHAEARQIELFMSDSPHESFTRVQMDGFSPQLLELHERVLGYTCRVELSDSAGNVCVLISKSELDALEKALEILSQTQDVATMRQQLSQLATSAET